MAATLTVGQRRQPAPDGGHGRRLHITGCPYRTAVTERRTLVTPGRHPVADIRSGMVPQYPERVSPRHNRRRRNGKEPSRADDDGPRDGGHLVPQRVQEWADGDWIVRPVTGATSGKVYRCPGCDQQIPAGVPHLVTWPADPIGADGGLDQRRHWHRPCWNARDRRRANIQRSRNAPRYG